MKSISTKISSRKSLFLFFIISAFSLTAQIIFLRECLYLYEQSEYIISFFWLFWLGANGIGVVAGRKINNLKSYYPGIYVAGLILFFYALKLLKPLLLTAQTLNSLGLGLFFTAIFLFIPSFLNGILFSSFSNSFKSKISISKFYLAEALAFMTSGLITSYIIYLFSDVYILFFLAVLILTSTYFIFRDKKSLILIAAILLILPYFAVRNYSVNKAFPTYKLANSSNTTSGRIDHMESRTSKHSFILFQGESIDFIYHPEASEEAVLPGIAQTGGSPQILITGGNYYPLVKALAGSKFNSADIIINDRLYHQEVKKKMPDKMKKFIDRDNVKIIHSSLQEYLRKTDNKYDLIYITSQNPALLENSFSYFPSPTKNIKNKLTKRGCAVYLFSPDAAVTGEVSASIKGSVFATLSNIYKDTEIMPLNHFSVIMASDKNIVTDVDSICTILDKRNIPRHYFGPVSTGMRMENTAAMNTQKITDYPKSLKLTRPVIYMAGLADVINRYDVNAANSVIKKAEFVYSNKILISLTVLILISALFIFFSVRKPGATAVFHAGFTALSYELMLLFLYQLFFGDIYLLIGVLIAVFMLGVSGGILLNHKLGINTSFKLSFLIFITSTLLIFLILLFHSQLLIFTGMLLSGAYLGLMFSLNSEIKKKESNEERLKLYAGDLLGSCTGNVLVPLIFIPFLGFYFPVILISLAALIIFFFLFRKIKRSI